MEMSDTLPVNQSLVSRLSESVKDWLTDSCMGFMFLYAAPGILFAGTRKKKDVFDSANVEKVDIKPLAFTLGLVCGTLVEVVYLLPRTLFTIPDIDIFPVNSAGVIVPVATNLIAYAGYRKSIN